MIDQFTTKEGHELGDLTYQSPVLLVFLRHFGCTFCREAMADIQSRKDGIKSRGVKIVLVHMSQHSIAEEYIQRFGLSDLDSISDINCDLYQHFGLVKGNFKQLFGLRSWIRGFEAGVVQGHGVGRLLGDGFQMPGVFLLEKGQVINQFIHQYASDRPNYDELLMCCGDKQSTSAIPSLK